MKKIRWWERMVLWFIPAYFASDMDDKGNISICEIKVWRGRFYLIGEYRNQLFPEKSQDPESLSQSNQKLLQSPES